MVVVVGLPFQCRGLYCFFEREDEPLGQRGYVNDKTVKHQMNMQFHTHTHGCCISVYGEVTKQPNISPDQEQTLY